MPQINSVRLLADLRRLAAEAGGSRARWLAGLNPDWTFVTAHAGAGQDAWRLGGKSQRRGYLAALRTRDPGAARELITASWEAVAGSRVGSGGACLDEMAREGGRWLFRYRKIDRFIAP